MLSITVDTLVDENDGVGVGGISLRDAIAAASPGETIEFSVTGTILLEHGELAINKSLTIAGPGANLLTIDADGESRVFLVNDNDNDGGALANVTLQDLTIQGGATSNDGGGIWSSENLSILRSVVRNNQADDGGGLYNFFGQFSIVDSTFSGNRSTDTADGGGGGVFNFSQTVAQTSRVSNSTFSDNATSNDAGAFPSRFGGGVYNFLGTLDVEFSTFTLNSALAGKGSGIATLGDTNAAITRVYSTIIAGNVNSDVDDVVGLQPSFQSLGFNLIGTGNAAASFVANGDSHNVLDPRLGSLADNGGATPTHALLDDSPAIDAGDIDAQAGIDGVPAYDQRGLPFGRVADGDLNAEARIDIGAFERRATIVVDTLADEFDGVGVGAGTSLREAIDAANTSLAGPLVVFDAALTESGPAMIELLLGPLEISARVSIVGPGAALLTIDAQQNSRVLTIDDSEEFVFADVLISGLTLTGGNDLDAGGAIFSHERLTVSDSLITGNSASLGGGVYNYYGYLTVLRSEISLNSGTTAGGGVDNRAGSAEIRWSTISGNDSPDGAGLRNSFGGETLLARSHVTGNLAGNAGGGILNESGSVTIEDSTVDGNEAVAGAGIFNSLDDLMVRRSTISGNTATASGGGIFNDFGNAYLSDSTLHGNSGSYGGGLYLAGSIDYTTVVRNSTISGNTASIAGGGIYNFQGAAYVEFSTITNNTAPDGFGGGIATWDDPLTAATNLHSTIVAGNVGSDLFVANENFNAFYSAGYNLIGFGAGSIAFNLTGDQIIGTDDPKLGPLADNGGPTLTHALLPGSPAIDAGDPAAVAGEGLVPKFDQRGSGFGRVRDGDAAEAIAIDVGAFEVQQFIAAPALPGDYNGDETVDAADYTVWRDTLGAEVTPYSGADGDGDGRVDQDDYGVWKSHFGQSLPAAGGAGAVAPADSFAADAVTLSASAEPPPGPTSGSLESARHEALLPPTVNTLPLHRVAPAPRGLPVRIAVNARDTLLAEWTARRETRIVDSDPEPAIAESQDAAAGEPAVAELDLAFAELVA